MPERHWLVRKRLAFAGDWVEDVIHAPTEPDVLRLRENSPNQYDRIEVYEVTTDLKSSWSA